MPSSCIKYYITYKEKKIFHWLGFSNYLIWVSTWQQCKEIIFHIHRRGHWYMMCFQWWSAHRNLDSTHLFLLTSGGPTHWAPHTCRAGWLGWWKAQHLALNVISFALCLPHCLRFMIVIVVVVVVVRTSGGVQRGNNVNNASFTFLLWSEIVAKNIWAPVSVTTEKQGTSMELASL